jgi:hypothetical protein
LIFASFVFGLCIYTTLPAWLFYEVEATVIEEAESELYAVG